MLVFFFYLLYLFSRLNLEKKSMVKSHVVLEEFLQNCINSYSVTYS